MFIPGVASVIKYRGGARVVGSRPFLGGARGQGRRYTCEEDAAVKMSWLFLGDDRCEAD